MNTEPYTTLQPPAPPRTGAAIRWTIVDLALVVGLTAILVLLVSFGLQLMTRLGLVDARALLQNNRVLSAVTSIAVVDLLLVLAIVLIIVVRKRGSWREIGFRAPPILPMLLTPIIFVGQMTLIMVINIGILLATGSFENPQQDLFLDPSGFAWSNYLLAMFAGAIIAPLVEELVFRGLLYQWLGSRTNLVIGAIGSTAVWTALHISPIVFPSIFAVGIVLTLAFQWSKSLWVPITLHFFQNAFVISLVFFVQANPQLIQPPA